MKGQPTLPSDDDRLLEENRNLKLRLEEAEAILEAIRTGQIDALVVHTEEGDRVFSLHTADYTYRSIVETMQEGAAALSQEGIVLYCNSRLAELLQIPIHRLMGGDCLSWVEENEKAKFSKFLARAFDREVREEFTLLRPNGTAFSALIAINQLQSGDLQALCAVVTDLSEIQSIRRINLALVDEITRRKRKHQELRNSQAQLRKTEQELRSINEQLEVRVEERTRELRRVSSYLEKVREEEGGRIAREIHDELGGGLSAAKIQLQLLQRQAGGDSDRLELGIGEVSDLLDQILQSVRRISKDIRPPLLDQFGLAAAVEGYLQDFCNRTGLTSSLEIQGDEMTDLDIATTVFRIFQESLTNVARHAAARHVLVSLKMDADNLVLEVSDDGKGIGELTLGAKTMGFLTMKERARRLGAHLEILATQPRGTTIRLSVPRTRASLAPEGK
jgi:PAS domain S-box-containing protein